MSLGRERGEGSVNGGGEAGEPQDPAATLRAGREWRRRCLLSASQIAIWRLGGPAGAATRATPMARFLAAERAPSRSLSSLGTCPSASRGLLNMGNRASPPSQRAGSGRGRLGGQARRPRRLRAASAPQHPRPARAQSPPHLALVPAAPTRAEPGPPALATRAATSCSRSIATSWLSGVRWLWSLWPKGSGGRATKMEKSGLVSSTSDTDVCGRELA